MANQNARDIMNGIAQLMSQKATPQANDAGRGTALMSGRDDALKTGWGNADSADSAETASANMRPHFDYIMQAAAKDPELANALERSGNGHLLKPPAEDVPGYHNAGSADLSQAQGLDQAIKQ